MKQQILNLKEKVLVVELPEGANRLLVFNDEDKPYLSYFIGVGTKRFYLPSKCVLIGKLTDMKESDFKPLVNNIGNSQFIFGDAYEDYLYDDYFYHTATESFYSALEANGILFKNKMLPPCSAPIYTHLEEYINEFKEAQKKIWNKEQTYLFKIL